MDPAASDHCTVFDGTRRIAAGPPEAVLTTARRAAEGGGRVQAFDDASGHPLEFDLRPDAPAPTARGRGRPRLGVTAREVTLLPRHWDWLAAQPGGASTALRRLVEAARKGPAERVRAGQEAAYRFMTAMAGDLADYEAATRALFAGDREGFAAAVGTWPADLGDHALRLAEPALDAGEAR
jgi:hypothetical protein